MDIQVGKMDEMKVLRKEDLTQQRIDWGLHAINAPFAWTITKGEDIRVAVLDTGIEYTHQDLEKNIASHVDFTNSRRGSMDVNGHGTHVAGIIAAKKNDFGVVGVAPESKIYSAKVLDSQGRGNFKWITQGIKWAIEKEVDLINLSLGGPSRPPEHLHQAIKEAVHKGIIIVAATGNDNGDICYPALYDECIAVSAVDQNLKRADFSNYGIQNEITAPGVDVLSTHINNSYVELSGTSMATPMIAGAAALYISKKKLETGKRPTVKETHQALLEATIDLGEEGRDIKYGEGMINLVKLLK